MSISGDGGSQEDPVNAAIERVLCTADGTAADLATMRAGLDAFAAAVSVRVAVAAVTDEVLSLPGRDLPLRTYQPEGADDAALVWFHGGGFVSGSLDAIDPVCRSLARRVGSTVVSVGYRLAPEDPYPAAVEDGLAAVAAVATRPGVRRVAIGGDSAGGGLAAVVARLTGVPLVAQVLLCPFLDVTLSSPSVREQGQDHLLTEAALRGFARMYVGPGGDPADPRVSPLLGTDFTGLAPTVVVTAEHDPLRDDGEQYADKVAAAGGTVHSRRWDGMEHGFVGMTALLAEAEQALQWTADRLRTLLDA